MAVEQGRYKHPESIAATARSFSEYLSKFSLVENSLAHRGTVLDIGSGWAEFVKTTNENYGQTGTKAIGMDPAYACLSPDLQKTKDKLEGSGIFLSFDQGVLHDLHLEEFHKKEEELFAEFYKEFTKSGNYIAGSHQDLPFKADSLDLVLANNSLHTNSPEFVKRALVQICLSLKAGGEFRVAPFFKPFSIISTSQSQEVRVEDWRDDSSERDALVKKLFQGDKVIESQIQVLNFISLMRGLEEDYGMNFYSVELYSGEGKDENNTALYSLIGVKGNKIPEINKTEEVFRLRKLIFKDAPDLENYLSDEVLKAHQVSGKIQTEIINL